MSKGLGFDCSWYDWFVFQFTESLQLHYDLEVVPGIFLEGKARLARKADNLTAICEAIV
jgi:hypothetical protein